VSLHGQFAEFSDRQFIAGSGKKWKIGSTATEKEEIKRREEEVERKSKG